MQKRVGKIEAVCEPAYEQADKPATQKPAAISLLAIHAALK